MAHAGEPERLPIRVVSAARSIMFEEGVMTEAFLGDLKNTLGCLIPGLRMESFALPDDPAQASELDINEGWALVMHSIYELSKHERAHLDLSECQWTFRDVLEALCEDLVPVLLNLGSILMSDSQVRDRPRNYFSCWARSDNRQRS